MLHGKLLVSRKLGMKVLVSEVLEFGSVFPIQKSLKTIEASSSKSCENYMSQGEGNDDDI